MLTIPIGFSSRLAEVAGSVEQLSLPQLIISVQAIVRFIWDMH
jgi:hypothetical protein